MDARVEQFLQDAQRLHAAQDIVKAAKEMGRLRTFLFKNQEHRFTDREQAHLFQAVQVHATAATSTSASGAPPPEQLKEAGLALVEDALKMPFNVFGTSHKKAFLKWHAKLTGGEEEAAAAGAAGTAGRRQRLQVIDADGSVVTVMSQDGETYEVGAGKGVSAELLASIRERFEGGDDVVVEVEGAPGSGLAIVAIVGQ